MTQSATVFASSTVTYQSQNRPITEDDPDDRGETQIEYGLHKLLCEDRLFAARQLGFATTMPFSMVLGPHRAMTDEQRMFADSGRPTDPRARRRLDRCGSATSTTKPALEQLMGRPATFDVATTSPAPIVTRNEYIALCAAAIGVDADVHHIPATSWKTSGQGSGRSTSSSSPAPSTSAQAATPSRCAGSWKPCCAPASCRINLVQHLAPNIHWWDQDTSFSIDRLQTDVGGHPNTPPPRCSTGTPGGATATEPTRPTTGLPRIRSWRRLAHKSNVATHHQPDVNTVHVQASDRRAHPRPALLIGSSRSGTSPSARSSTRTDRPLKPRQREGEAQVAANIAGAISLALPDGTPVTEEQIDAAALAVLNDDATGPLNSLGETHRSFLGLNDVPQTVDLNPVAEVAANRSHRSHRGHRRNIRRHRLVHRSPHREHPELIPVKTFLETSVPFPPASRSSWC